MSMSTTVGPVTIGLGYDIVLRRQGKFTFLEIIKDGKTATFDISDGQLVKPLSSSAWTALDRSFKQP